MAMNVVVVYILLTSHPWIDYALRFVDTYLRFPAGYEHTLIVVCNDRDPDDVIRSIFNGIPCVFIRGTNVGKDIGAWQSISHEIDCDIQVCFGSSVYFKRSGWMRRMWEAWMKYGPAFYGASASFKEHPHFQTTAFWCPPEIIRSYSPIATNDAQRYEFEHGNNSILFLAAQYGYPCIIVQWDGEYEYPWRYAPGCSYKGNQDNLLVWWNHPDGYANSSPWDKRRIERDICQ